MIVRAHPRAPQGRDRRDHRRGGAVQHRRGAAGSRDSWERLRELATAHGTVLIFDEVKTGVVIAYGGATEYFGVQPDLFCLAKSIGGGTPIGAFGGRAEVMRVIEGGAKSR